MSVWRLVAKELLYRKLNFGLGVVSVLVAVGCLVAELTLLNRHDVQSSQIIALKQAETEHRMRLLEDDYRKITKQLGFNVLILPGKQKLADLYTDNYVSEYMPEDYVAKLASSDAMTVRHLLPILQEKLKWPEQERTILLIGTRGEVPVMHRLPREPMLDPVPRGTIVLGHELHRGARVAVGDKVTLLGRPFTVTRCHDERGTKDDVTAWINLEEAQEMLDRRGRINAILALSCFCEGPRLGRIRAEIAAILPETQVIELASQAITRAEARDRAAREAQEAVEGEKRHRAELRTEQEAFAALLVPLVTVGCVVWIGLLAFANVRERRSEVGILRALGVKSTQILFVFLAKAALIGLFGAVIGYAAGLAVGAMPGSPEPGAAEAAFAAPGLRVLFDVRLMGLVLLLAPCLACLASFIPAMIAAQQDPALVLREA